MSRRNLKAHKGDFGHVFILAGSSRYSGAAALCSFSAMRSGAGLATLGIPKSINSALIKIKPKEAMTLPLPETRDGSLSMAAYVKARDFAKTADAVVIGPGLTQNKSTQALTRRLIAAITKPMVIDADGLNAIVNHLDILTTANDQRLTTILTPHPGEMARLLGVSIKQVQDDRMKHARSFAKKYKVILVLKGFRTVVAGPSGRTFINRTGNPGMATAGSGDVLSGMLGAFLGQGLEAFEAAKFAVYLHGLAGDLAAKEKTKISLIASDIIDKIPEAVRSCIS